MLVSRLVAPVPGETVIDACAGSGGKTTHLAALMENRGRILACDTAPAKLEALSRHAARVGATIIEGVHCDAARLGEQYPGFADRVLVDSPCSGLGVLARRPEIRWRVGPDQLPGLGARQRELLAGAAGAVRPGGLLVFAVCSLEPDEGPAAAAWFLDAHRDYEPDPIRGWPPGNGDDPAPAPARGGPGTAFLYPHVHDTDGFFVAAFRRRR